MEASKAQAINIKSFLKIVKKYTEPTELTPQLLHEFVDKIVVHEADKSSGHRIQRIDVHYNFVGEIAFSPEYCEEKEVTARRCYTVLLLPRIFTKHSLCV